MPSRMICGNVLLACCSVSLWATTAYGAQPPETKGRRGARSPSVSVRGAPASAQWVAPEGVHSVSLSPKQLLASGVAQIQIPPALLVAFTSSSRRELSPQGQRQANAEAFLAAEKLAEHCKRVMREAHPRLTMTFSDSFGLSAFSRSSKRRHQRPSQEHWHADAPGGTVNSTVLAAFAAGRLENLTVKGTLPAPADIFPPTLAKPVGGEHAGRVVQGKYGTLTLFVTDVVEHVADDRYNYPPSGRALLNWGFAVLRQR